MCATWRVPLGLIPVTAAIAVSSAAKPSHMNQVIPGDRYKRRANLTRRQKLALVIFVVAVAARLGFVAVCGSIATPDTAGYQLLAQNLVHFHAFSASEKPPLQTAIFRPPVYPFFLALLSPAGHPAIIPAIAQGVLDALVCAMLFLMASRVARPPFAVAVSLLYALHPGAIAASATLLSDALFTALLFAAGCLAMMAAERMSSTLALFSGVTFGLATLCRSIGVLVLIAVACVLIVRRFRRMALVLALGAVILIAPWIVRSSRVAGRFVFIQAPSFINWYVPTLWWIDQNDETAIWRYFYIEDPYGVRLNASATPAEVMRAEDFGRSQAIVNVRRNPGNYLLSRARAFPHLFLSTFDRFTGINRSLGDVARVHDVGSLAIKLALMLLFTALPMVAACLGLSASRRTLAASLAAAVWIVTLAVHIPMWIEFRYWLPAMPFQFVTAAIGLEVAFDRDRSRSRPFTATGRPS